jgi:hypothetical protein
LVIEQSTIDATPRGSHAMTWVKRWSAFARVQREDQGAQMLALPKASTTQEQVNEAAGDVVDPRHQPSLRQDEVETKSMSKLLTTIEELLSQDNARLRIALLKIKDRASVRKETDREIGAIWMLADDALRVTQL